MAFRFYGFWKCGLTIVGGVRERLVVTRRGRRKTLCARTAWVALLCGPSTSPLGGYLSSPYSALVVHTFRVALAALTMVAIAFTLWLILGVLISMLGLERYFGATSAFVWVVSITLIPILA